MSHRHDIASAGRAETGAPSSWGADASTANPPGSAPDGRTRRRDDCAVAADPPGSPDGERGGGVGGHGPERAIADGGASSPPRMVRASQDGRRVFVGPTSGPQCPRSDRRPVEGLEDAWGRWMSRAWASRDAGMERTDPGSSGAEGSEPEQNTAGLEGCVDAPARRSGPGNSAVGEPGWAPRVRRGPLGEHSPRAPGGLSRAGSYAPARRPAAPRSPRADGGGGASARWASRRVPQRGAAVRLDDARTPAWTHSVADGPPAPNGACPREDTRPQSSGVLVGRRGVPAGRHGEARAGDPRVPEDGMTEAAPRWSPGAALELPCSPSPGWSPCGAMGWMPAHVPDSMPGAPPGGMASAALGLRIARALGPAPGRAGGRVADAAPGHWPPADDRGPHAAKGGVQGDRGAPAPNEQIDSRAAGVRPRDSEDQTWRTSHVE